MSSQGRAAPPQLLFYDDGSRIMTEQQAQPAEENVSPRGNTSIEIYYEVDRIVQEILALDILPRDGWSCRVALQFPDSQLQDAPHVCWAVQHSLKETSGEDSLVFILGDSTFAPCCPDQVSALHLEADVLVHYGHACLSPALSLPVLYSFGITDFDVEACASRIVQQAREESVQNLLVLYEVRYHHAMEQLEAQLQSGNLNVLMGRIPQHFCSGATEENQDDKKNEESMVVGGLQIATENGDLSSYTLLFVGDADTSSRQYVNVMLRFLSMPCGAPAAYWTYSPSLKTLDTSLPPTLQRRLNRRFYLTQKARDAKVYGILVGTLTQKNTRQVVSTLTTVIQDAGKSCYTLAVGKINGAKLANFAEIECFVLVACAEHSLLDDERDLHVPVITPLELDIALGNVEWGTMAYSLDSNDFLARQGQESATASNDDDDDKDAPYFSLVTGKYVDFKKTEVDLTTLPGKGQVMAYKSEAANFLKHRQYQGLETNLGKTQVHAAVDGQDGIASDYGK